MVAHFTQKVYMKASNVHKNNPHITIILHTYIDTFHF